MDLLEIYVEDHLALSLGGLKLARRCLRENRGTPLGPFLERLVTELEDDRAILEEVARALGACASRVKELAASLGEWAGRLKPNGRLFGYSDLSRVWELEALMAGSESRRALWKVLGTVRRSTLGGFDFARLEERARGHRDQLERQRVRAARAAFGPPARASGTRAAAASAR